MYKIINYEGELYLCESRHPLKDEIVFPEYYSNGPFLYSPKDPGSGKYWVVKATTSSKYISIWKIPSLTTTFKYSNL